jgi:hypothetical protein
MFDPSALDPFLSMLRLEELAEALDELTELERRGAIGPRDAAAWRERIQSWSLHRAGAAVEADQDAVLVEAGHLG